MSMPETEPRQVKRKVIAAREDLVNELAIIAKKRGSTLYALVNEIIEQAIRAEAMGVALREVLDVYEFLRANRAAGLTTLPIDFLNTLASRNSDDNILKLAHECGKWYGEFLLIRFAPNTTEPQDLAPFIERILRETRWELTEVSARAENDCVRIRAVSLVLNAEATKIVARYIEGLLNAFNYYTKHVNTHRGIIDVIACRSSS